MDNQYSRHYNFVDKNLNYLMSDINGKFEYKSTVENYIKSYKIHERRHYFYTFRKKH